ncbi:Zn-dependent hydrolase [Alloyangia pacifica]|uniref:N-carbamoyl-L-amino-acid hydrolase n=1 Tax=Alloyangia pacifica TaxID=311180 RepID=A0A1I6UZZ3_9RHOB|nr:Zn-dependent hydrolase [Alloyangia pacifica]SDI32174.1 N-carbamoyl-L-amino-acid hydrolase [Alloyangia pacifica]SFT06917.1 N-carbamoyl-L-amino-acid hydrolase [Alloyangia pacifica]
MNAPAPSVEPLDTLAARLFDDIRGLAPDAEGVSRPAFSEDESRVLGYLAREMAAQGLAVEEDAGRNLVFCLPEHAEAEAWDLIGSHVDSVPCGGNYDGLAGIVAGLLVLLNAHRGDSHLQRPLKCIALRAEESAWFGTCYLGSKMLTGQLTQKDLSAPHKGDGRPLRSHLDTLGIDTEAVAAGTPLGNMSRVLSYVELHIEQGPQLVEAELPVAVVSAIRGNFRFRQVQCIGQAGHSGTVPQKDRHDAVLAYADFMNGLETHCLERLSRGSDLVMTSGVVGTDPDQHAIARIPGSVSFSLDIRSGSKALLAELRAEVEARMSRIAKTREVRFLTGAVVETQPAELDPAVTAALERAMTEVAGRGLVLTSGAGHDAAVFAGAGVPTGMVFVRNRNGSHNPQEAMEIADLMVGVEVLKTYFSQPTSADITQTSIDEANMFDDLIEIFEARGKGLHAHEALATAARTAAMARPDMAVALHLIASRADAFAERHDRMPLTAKDVARAENALRALISTLEEALSAESDSQALASLAVAAQKCCAEELAQR